MDSHHSIEPRRGSVAFDLLLTLAVFAGMTLMLRSHVPGYSPLVVLVVSAFTASCIAGVFWLALQMFKVVVAHQRESQKEDRTEGS